MNYKVDFRMHFLLLAPGAKMASYCCDNHASSVCCFVGHQSHAHSIPGCVINYKTSHVMNSLQNKKTACVFALMRAVKSSQVLVYVCKRYIRYITVPAKT